MCRSLLFISTSGCFRLRGSYARDAPNFKLLEDYAFFVFILELWDPWGIKIIDQLSKLAQKSLWRSKKLRRGGWDNLTSFSRSLSRGDSTRRPWKERKGIREGRSVGGEEDKKRGDRGRAMGLVLVEAAAGPGYRRAKENRSRANGRPRVRILVWSGTIVQATLHDVEGCREELDWSSTREHGSSTRYPLETGGSREYSTTNEI